MFTSLPSQFRGDQMPDNEANGIRILGRGRKRVDNSKEKAFSWPWGLKGPKQVGAGEPTDGSRGAVSIPPTMGELCLKSLEDPLSPSASPVY